MHANHTCKKYPLIGASISVPVREWADCPKCETYAFLSFLPFQIANCESFWCGWVGLKKCWAGSALLMRNRSSAKTRFELFLAWLIFFFPGISLFRCIPYFLRDLAPLIRPCFCMDPSVSYLFRYW